MRYFVSVVVIAYNTLNYIEECLESVFSQNLKNTEIIIIDNHSTDGTSEKIQSLIKSKPNVKYLYQKKNLGGANAGNLGIEKARGKYVFLMDSDDVLPPDALKNLYKTAKKNNSSLVIGRGKSIYGEKVDNFKFKLYSVPSCLTGVYNNLNDRPELLISPFYWGKLFSKKMMKRNKIYMKKDCINADIYLSLKALKYAKNITVTNKLTYLWRRFQEDENHIATTSKANLKNSFYDRVESYKATEALFCNDKYKIALDNLKIYNVLRYLILSPLTATDHEFLEKYFKVMQEVLSDIPMQSICDSPYFNSRKKLLCYFVKQNMPQEFAKYANLDLQPNKNTQKNQVLMEWSELPKDIPQELLTQPRSKIKSCNIDSYEYKDDKCIFSITATIPSKSKFKAVLAILKDQNGYEVCAVKPKKINKIKNAVTLCFKMPVSKLETLNRDREYTLSLEYLLNGIFSESVINSDKEILLCDKILNIH